MKSPNNGNLLTRNADSKGSLIGWILITPGKFITNLPVEVPAIIH
jgi:hypothetical protein